ncbi:hypothetical protein D3C86_2243320 [compost metagenome]
MIKTEAALSKSHQTIVSLGLQRSANAPPIKEKINIGANSATEIKDNEYGSLFVISVT